MTAEPKPELTPDSVIPVDPQVIPIIEMLFAERFACQIALDRAAERLTQAITRAGMAAGLNEAWELNWETKAFVPKKRE